MKKVLGKKQNYFLNCMHGGMFFKIKKSSLYYIQLMVKKLLPKKDEDIKETESEPEEIEEIKTKPKKVRKK